MTPSPDRRALAGLTVVAPACVSAIGVALAGVVLFSAVALIVRLTGSDPSLSTWEAERAALQAWLLANGAEITVSWGRIGLVPLGLSLALVILLYRGGAHLARHTRIRALRPAAVAVATMAATYGVVAAALAAPASGGSVTVSAGQAGLTAALIAVGAAGTGVLRESGVGHRLLAATPGPGQAVARAAAAGLLSLVAVGALTVAIAVVTSASRYAELSRALAPGFGDALALTVVGLLVLPNAVLAAVALGAGPGFAIGGGTLVSLSGVQLGPVPALPLLAALPDTERLPALGWLSLFGPLLAGLAVGVVMVRSLDDEDNRGPGAVALWAALGGGLVGAATGMLTGFGSGPLGDGRLLMVGSSGWAMAGAVAVEVAGLAAAAAAALRWAQADGLLSARRTDDAEAGHRPDSVDDDAVEPAVAPGEELRDAGEGVQDTPEAGDRTAEDDPVNAADDEDPDEDPAAAGDEDTADNTPDDTVDDAAEPMENRHDELGHPPGPSADSEAEPEGPRTPHGMPRAS